MKKRLVVIIVLISILSACNVFNNSTTLMNQTSQSNHVSEITIPSYDEYGFMNRPIYEGIYTERVPDEQTCIEKRSYREVTSSQESWIGIESTVVLPDFIIDTLRIDSDNNLLLDYPSIFLTSFVDSFHYAGVRLANNYKEDFFIQYNIFWEYQNKVNDKKTTIIGANDTNYVFFPGDKIKMSLYLIKQNLLQFDLLLIEESNDPIYQTLRQTISNPSAFYKSSFTIPNNNLASSMFKRTVELNQSGNTIQTTNAKIINAKFEEVYLYKIMYDEVYKFPFANNRIKTLNCPIVNSDYFKVDYQGVNQSLGGEIIDLNYN